MTNENTTESKIKRLQYLLEMMNSVITAERQEEADLLLECRYKEITYNADSNNLYFPSKRSSIDYIKNSSQKHNRESSTIL